MGIGSERATLSTAACGAWTCQRSPNGDAHCVSAGNTGSRSVTRAGNTRALPGIGAP